MSAQHEEWHVKPATPGMPAYICTDPSRHMETEIAVLYGSRADEYAKRIVAAVNASNTPSETKAKVGWCIRHVDGRWRTMDTMGMPDWTDDAAKALCCRLREHADAYATDDPDDVRIVEVAW